MSAMRPIWVAWPVAVTTNVAEPRVTWVFWNTRFVRSPSAVSPAGSVVRSLATGALSPVSAASCTSRVAEVTMRPSAGTTSPASISTTSPGTSVVESTSSTSPDRRTRALRHLELGQRLDAGPRLHLLVRAHDDVERHQREHDDARRDLPDGEAGAADDQQHDVHRVGQLAPGDRPRRSAAAPSAARSARTRPAAEPPLGGQAPVRLDAELRRAHPASSSEYQVMASGVEALVVVIARLLSGPTCSDLDMFRPGPATRIRFHHSSRGRRSARE